MKEYQLLLGNDRIPQLKKVRTLDYPDVRLNNSEKIVAFMNKAYQLHKRAEEYIYMLSCDTKERHAKVFEISHGTATSSILNSRELFIRLLLSGATGFFLVHNHPSGDPEPSREDLLLTKIRRKALCFSYGDVRRFWWFL